MISPELQSKIMLWRHKASEGTLTTEEMREAVKAMRQDRLAAGAAVGTRKSKGPMKSADDLLSELGNL
jgi:hypothetical protein